MSRAHYRMTLYSAPCRSSRPRALMNRNSNPLHRELFSPNTGDTTRNLPTGIRPYGRSWQRPGVTPDHWPAGAGELECPGGVPGWAKYGSAARSPVHLRENLKVVSFAANSQATMAIWAAGVGAPPGHPLARPSGKSFTIILAISGIPAVSVFAQPARLARERVRLAAAIRAGARIQGRAAA